MAYGTGNDVPDPSCGRCPRTFAGVGIDACLAPNSSEVDSAEVPQWMCEGIPPHGLALYLLFGDGPCLPSSWRINIISPHLKYEDTQRSSSHTIVVWMLEGSCNLILLTSMSVRPKTVQRFACSHFTADAQVMFESMQTPTVSPLGLRSPIT